MWRKVSYLLLALVGVVAVVGLSQPAFAGNIDLKKQEEGAPKIFAPMIRVVYTPPTPILNSIDNEDLDSSYTITWQPLEEPVTPATPISITIEEASNPEFTDKAVYQIIASGTDSEWSPTSESSKLPGTYYYHMNSSVGSSVGDWSNTETVTIYPLFIGLKVRWDGVGYARGSRHEDIGVHTEWNADRLTEGDTIQIRVNSWYDPDPFDFGDEDYNLFYSATTGTFRSSNTPDDPSWKWGNPSFLSYDLQLANKQTISMGNQPFEVTGPFTGYTTYGQSIQYWELINKNKFTMYENGKWRQYVHEGDAVLRYHTGNSRLLLYSSVRRHYYYDGERTDDTIQYIEQLSSSSALTGSSIFVRQSNILVDKNEVDTDYLSNEDPTSRFMNGNNSRY